MFLLRGLLICGFYHIVDFSITLTHCVSEVGNLEETPTQNATTIEAFGVRDSTRRSWYRCTHSRKASVSPVVYVRCRQNRKLEKGHLEKMSLSLATLMPGVCCNGFRITRIIGVSAPARFGMGYGTPAVRPRTG